MENDERAGIKTVFNSGNHKDVHSVHDDIRSWPWAPRAILPTRETWRLLKAADLLRVLSLRCKVQSFSRKETSQVC